MPNLRYYFLIFIVLGIFFAMTMKGISGSPSKAEILANYSSPGQPFESSQERGRFALMQSIFENKTFRLDNFNDFSLPDVSYKDGHYYSVFPPGVSALLIIPYSIGKMVNQPIIAVFLLPIIFCLLTSMIIFAVSRRLNLSKTASYLAAIIFPLATIAWSYSTTIYAHTFSAFCIMAGLLFALRSKNGSGRNHFAVWLLYGISILIDYPNAVIMLPIVIFMIISSFRKIRVDNGSKWSGVLAVKTAFLYTILPFIICVLALGYYNYLTLGSWSALAHNYRVTEMVNGSVNYQYIIGNTLDFKFTENGLYTLLFSKGRGLFFYAPILILTFFGLDSLYRKSSRTANTIVLVILFNLIVYASFYDPWGGWSYGPRYLIVSMPFLAILVGESFDRYKRKSSFVLLFILLFFASFSIALIGALTTNLIAPAPESGSQLNFVSLLPRLAGKESSLFLFNYFQRYNPVALKEYFLAILSFSGVVFLPVFLYQIIQNIHRAFMKIKKPILTIQKGTLSVQGK